MPRPAARSLCASSPAAAPCAVAARLAASRPFMNRQERSASTPPSRTALAGEMAIANSGLPAAIAASRSQRGGRQVGVAQDGVGCRDLVARLAAAQLLGEGKLVELHVGKPGDHLAVAVEQRRVARRRAVEEDRGKVADLAAAMAPRDVLAGRVAAAHRQQRSLDAALHGVAQRIEDAAADILAPWCRGLEAPGTNGPDIWPRRSIWAPPTASSLRQRHGRFRLRKRQCAVMAATIGGRRRGGNARSIRRAARRDESRTAPVRPPIPFGCAGTKQK